MRESLFPRVSQFVADFTCVPPNKIGEETTLFGDLGVDGDDGVELLVRFGEEFDVDLSSVDLSKHFGPEGGAPWAIFAWIAYACRRGSAEQKARLVPITVGDLCRAAESGKFAGCNRCLPDRS